MFFKGKKRLEQEENYLQTDDDIYKEFTQSNNNSNNQTDGNLNNQNNETINPKNFNDLSFNNQLNQNDNNSNNSNNTTPTNTYTKEGYKTNTLEEHTQITKASAISRYILIGFYAFAIIIGIALFLIIRSNKYAYYLKSDEILLDVGSSYQIELQPKNERYFDYLKYKYTTQDENIATVDEYGTVTAVGAGTTTLKISLKPGFTNTQTVKIVVETLDVSEVQIGIIEDDTLKIADSFELDNNQSVTLKAVANNREDLNVSAKYKSSNPQVATVDAFGNVTSKHDGVTVITAEINGVEANVTIHVKTGSSGTVIEPTPVPSNDPTNNSTPRPVTPKPGSSNTTPKPTSSSNLSIGVAGQITKYVNEQLKLTAKLNGSSVSNSSVKWSSSNPQVATVSNGLIECKSVGTTVITAEVNGSKATSKLVVKNKPSGNVTPKPATPKPSSSNTTPKPSSSTAPESTFNKNYVQFSTQSITINKGATATFKVKLYNAAGLFNIKSSNTAIATVDKATLWLDGVSEDDGKAYWAEKDVVVTGVKAGTTTIVITDSDIGTYDSTPKELHGKHVINVTVK